MRRFITGAEARDNWEKAHEGEDDPELEALRANLRLAEEMAKVSDWEQVLELLRKFDRQFFTGMSVPEKTRIAALCDEARAELNKEPKEATGAVQYDLPL